MQKFDGGAKIYQETDLFNVRNSVSLWSASSFSKMELIFSLIPGF